MNTITIDGVEYSLIPVGKLPAKQEEIGTTASYEVISDSSNPVKMSFIIDDETGELYKREYSAEIDGEYIDSEPWIDNLYSYLKGGEWGKYIGEEPFGDKEWADSLSLAKKQEFIEVYERAIKLGWI